MVKDHPADQPSPSGKVGRMYFGTCTTTSLHTRAVSPGFDVPADVLAGLGVLRRAPGWASRRVPPGHELGAVRALGLGQDAADV
jgi:hypothetical protein